MTHDRQNGTETRYVAPPGEGSRVEASLATDDRPESMAMNGRTNWAWANGRLGYDWMDSHYLVTDFA
ncbi:hypothetical protein R69888_05121 [Paraburkholderia haematera]|uniref:Uncharacterized protein n=1 Tax=Paraburkholderia haematera TaxID=2793077 RepID=A0ABN7MEI7_9BURK|nr:hypothetical protein R69888_05121 [Paraburkholderia haematera]